MASYHLAVKTIKRSAGRSATAAAAYRSAGAIFCEREGRLHDYSRKGGVAESFIVLPDGAPDWAGDRAALWNAAEAAETRSNSVTAREWELALPAEISEDARREVAHGFAAALVERYGVVADVAIHAPHREGDARNHHAHVLTSTRRLEPEGFGAKTRVLDAARTGGPEIEVMRGLWSELQNSALERAGEAIRVDHRSLEAPRAAAFARGDALAAEALTRAPEIKLGPAANAMERRERQAAEAAGRAYVPVTERGRAVHEAREARRLFVELREELRGRMERAREAYGASREEGRDRISAGLAALRAAVEKQRGAGQDGERGAAQESVRERLQRILERDAARREAAKEVERGREVASGARMPEPERTSLRERPERALGLADLASRPIRDDARNPQGRQAGRTPSRGRGDDDGWER